MNMRTQSWPQNPTVRDAQQMRKTLQSKLQSVCWFTTAFQVQQEICWVGRGRAGQSSRPACSRVTRLAEILV